MGHRRGFSGIGGAGGHGPGDRLIIGKADALQPGGWILRVDDMDSDRGKYALQFAISADQQKRSEEHTSELQSLMRISYAVFCLNKKNDISNPSDNTRNR